MLDVVKSSGANSRGASFSSAELGMPAGPAAGDGSGLARTGAAAGRATIFSGGFLKKEKTMGAGGDCRCSSGDERSF